MISLILESKNKLTETETRLVVARGWGWGKYQDVGQRAQTLVIK